MSETERSLDAFLAKRNDEDPLFYQKMEQHLKDMIPRKIADNILFGLSNMGFEFEADILETLDAIEELITEDTDLKQVVLYVINNFIK